MNAVDHVKAALTDAQNALAALIENEAMLETIAQAAHVIAQSQRQGGAVYSCGNGGSLCDAMHFAEEMTGRYRQDRKPYRAAAISDVSHMACVGNDYGYEHVFSRWIEAMGTDKDVLIAITTSGTSKNIGGGSQGRQSQGRDRGGSDRQVRLSDHGIGRHCRGDACGPMGRPRSGTAHQSDSYSDRTHRA